MGDLRSVLASLLLSLPIVSIRRSARAPPVARVPRPPYTRSGLLAMTGFSRSIRTVVASTLLLGALGLVAHSASADSQAKATLTIRLVVKDNVGQVGCTLFNSEKGFPKDGSAALQRKWCAIQKLESVCPFAPIPAGTYAVACFHDENKNGKVDTNLIGVPTEGTVASNNARGSMGPPRFEDAKFSFSGKPTELRLKVNY
jgi:uncharacterized protein (DUF2141 family)